MLHFQILTKLKITTQLVMYFTGDDDLSIQCKFVAIGFQIIKCLTWQLLHARFKLFVPHSHCNAISIHLQLCA